MKKMSFTLEMLQAILDGQKTQTRRIIKPEMGGKILGACGNAMAMEHYDTITDEEDENVDLMHTINCPYGFVGQILNTQQMPDLHLQITEIRIEKLQDIKVSECLKEGIGDPFLYNDSITLFKEYWDSIFGLRAWESNPFVWVISFKPLKKVSV